MSLHPYDAESETRLCPFVFCIEEFQLYNIRTLFCLSSSRSGRHAYDDKDDMALLLFVKEHKEGYPIKGNMLYKKAAQAKVTKNLCVQVHSYVLMVLALLWFFRLYFSFA